MTSTLLGVSRVEQLRDNLAARELALDLEHLRALDRVSLGEPRMLYGLGRGTMRQHAVFGGATVRGFREAAWAQRHAGAGGLISLIRPDAHRPFQVKHT